MGKTVGREVLESTGRKVMLTYDGAPEWKEGGITIDWANVAAVSGAPRTMADGRVVPIGAKALDLGDVLYDAGSEMYRLATNATALVRDKVAVLNEVLLESDRMSNHPGVIVGGSVWAARLKVGGGTNPTLAALLTAMPRLRTVG